MTTTVATVLSQLAVLVQEDNSNRGGSDWSNGFWTPEEIIGYLNAASKEFVLQSQIIKLIAAVPAVAGQRIYADPSYTMQMDRIAFNNKATYRTTRLNLDRESPKWRTLSGIPRQYHQDQLSTKTFETDRAPTSVMVGAGYRAIGVHGTLRYMMHATTNVSDGAIAATTNVFNSASATFTLTDVGKTIAVAGAGPGGTALITTISGFNTAHQVTLTANASTTVTGASAAWTADTTFYTATLPGGGGGGLFRYSIGAPAINGVLPHNRPFAGTIRQMLSGLTNFEILATRLMDDVSEPADLMRVPDFTLVYVKFWTLMQMLNKEGEGQDLPRAKYCKLRFDFGVQLFRRLVSAVHDKVTQPQGAPQ